MAEILFPALVGKILCTLPMDTVKLVEPKQSAIHWAMSPRVVHNRKPTISEPSSREAAHFSLINNL